jgi:hypothetical protein
MADIQSYVNTEVFDSVLLADNWKLRTTRLIAMGGMVDSKRKIFRT